MKRSVASSRSVRATDVALADLSIEDFQAACPVIDAEVYSVLGTKNAVARPQQATAVADRRLSSNQVAYWREKLGLS